MDGIETRSAKGAMYPVRLHIEPAIEQRNRLTTAFRVVLAIPHLLLVGGPIGATLSWGWSTDTGLGYDWGAGGGVLGAVATVVAVISWFAILFTGRQPEGLWNVAAFYLRWRVRAVAYTALLRDEYPPFGEGAYGAELELVPPVEPRDRLTVGFRIILAIPHLLAVWVLSIAWVFATIIAWFAILLTGRYPEGLYHFGVGVLRWNTRVEAYLLLLHDEYPPFSLGEVNPSENERDGAV
ncbi:MAG: DUF4389 domain-containing protein [Dehalococcoidia bacterium]